jgi:hypothetical protein
MESKKETLMSKDRESDEAGRSCAYGTVGTSRREFLASAVPGLALTAAWPASAASPLAQGETSAQRHPLEDILRRYGSELGDLTRLS